MASLVLKNVNDPPLMAVGGRGTWIETGGGRKILDSCGGVVVSALGHCHPEMQDAMRRAAGQLAWAHAGSFTTPEAEELAAFLVDRSGGMARCTFLSGGSEVMELALKVALQVHRECGDTARRLFISRRQSYHGSTLGMLAVSGNPARRHPFEDVLPDIPFVSPCNAYRGMLAGETTADYVERLAAELAHTIETLGPETVAGFMAEPIVGSTAGAVPFVPGYLRRMQEVCRAFGVLFLVDDVMCGMGRSGYLFSHLEDGFVPDMIAIGKGLAAGYQPISALLLSEPVHAAIAEGSGILRNGQTHVNHPFACAVALAAQGIVERDGLVARAADLGAELRRDLGALLGDHPNVGDIRGKGLMIGVELVASRNRKSSLAAPGEIASRLKSEALRRDMLIYPGSGTIDGHLGNHVMFAPAFVSSRADMSEIAGRFAETLAAALPEPADCKPAAAREI